MPNLLNEHLEEKRVIGIDAVTACGREKTGVGQYAQQVIRAMAAQPTLDHEQVELFSLNPLCEELADVPVRWSSRVVPWKWRRGWMSIKISWELWRRPVDVFFVPAQALPLITRLHKKRTQFVTTIHDVGFLAAPALYATADRKRQIRALHRAVAKADVLLAPSQFTKQQLQKYTRAKEAQMVVTPLGAPSTQERDVSDEKRQRVRHAHRLGTRFFLYVGRLDEKKNVRTLIEAFDRWKTTRGVGDPYELVLVGPKGYGFEKIKKAYEGAVNTKSIRALGYVAQEDMSAIMALSSACVFPSWYEGFGLPVLEAMAAGVPVVCSDIPAHHEVAGEAALFVPAGDPSAWARAFETMTQDVRAREELVYKGSARVGQFSWEKTAQATWGALRSLLR